MLDFIQRLTFRDILKFLIVVAALLSAYLFVTKQIWSAFVLIVMAGFVNFVCASME